MGNSKSKKKESVLQETHFRTRESSINSPSAPSSIGHRSIDSLERINGTIAPRDLRFDSRASSIKSRKVRLNPSLTPSRMVIKDDQFLHQAATQGFNPGGIPSNARWSVQSQPRGSFRTARYPSEIGTQSFDASALPPKAPRKTSSISGLKPKSEDSIKTIASQRSFVKFSVSNSTRASETFNSVITIKEEEEEEEDVPEVFKWSTGDTSTASPESQQETVPEETVPEEIVPEETVPEEIVSEETVPEEIVPEKTVSDETTEKESIPSDEPILSSRTEEEEDMDEIPKHDSLEKQTRQEVWSVENSSSSGKSTGKDPTASSKTTAVPQPRSTPSWSTSSRKNTIRPTPSSLTVGKKKETDLNNNKIKKAPVTRSNPPKSTLASTSATSRSKPRETPKPKTVARTGAGYGDGGGVRGCCRYSNAPPVYISSSGGGGGGSDYQCSTGPRPVNPLDRLQNVDVIESLSYYPPKGDGCCSRPNPCEISDMYSICECCGEIEYLGETSQNQEKMNSKKPVTYTRKQRFNFRSEESPRFSAFPSDGEPPYIWPSVANPRCRPHRVSSFDEIPVGKNPGCRNKPKAFSGGSGEYYFDAEAGCLVRKKSQKDMAIVIEDGKSKKDCQVEINNSEEKIDSRPLPEQKPQPCCIIETFPQERNNGIPAPVCMPGAQPQIINQMCGPTTTEEGGNQEMTVVEEPSPAMMNPLFQMIYQMMQNMEGKNQNNPMGNTTGFLSMLNRMPGYAGTNGLSGPCIPPECTLPIILLPHHKQEMKPEETKKAGGKSATIKSYDYNTYYSSTTVTGATQEPTDKDTTTLGSALEQSDTETEKSKTTQSKDKDKDKGKDKDKDKGKDKDKKKKKKKKNDSSSSSSDPE